jgi:hypothetical protein
MPDPLYRITYDTTSLLQEHPPQFRHPHKAALFKIAYPNDGALDRAGAVEVTRWAEHVDEPILLPVTGFRAAVRSGFYDYHPVGDCAAPCLEWHVNFADPRLFAAYGSGLFAQDEMQVAEHPMLACVREALLAGGLAAKTSDETGATPILVRNVERRIEVSTNPDASAGRPLGLYGNRFAAAAWDAVRRAARRIEPPTRSNIIAMAAPSGGRGEYSESEIESIFATALTAFAAARDESIRALGPSCRTIVHSGFWGCGAFGGNRKLMTALQALAARAAKNEHLILHAGNTPGDIEDANRGLEVADSLASRCGTSCSLGDLVGRCAMLAYRWGVSDGN